MKVINIYPSRPSGTLPMEGKKKVPLPRRGIKGVGISYLSLISPFQEGFTIIELLVVIGIIFTLLGLVTVNLLKTQHNANVSASVDQLLSDMRVQQTKAMAGTEDTNGNANSYGITLNANSYVLFQGSSTGSSADFTVTPDVTTFSTNLPSSKVVFAQRSGEIGGGPYTITVTNTYGGESKTITINRYGVVTSVQ